MKKAHLFITGDVIGVGFRSFVKKNAENLGLKGYVQNILIPDKGVLCVVEGEIKDIKRLISICNQGPEISFVTEVKVSWSKASHMYQNFSILK